MSNEGGADGSTYRSEFRNLFGGDSHTDDDNNGRDRAGPDPINSIQPSSLLSQEPMQMFEEQSSGQNNSNITPSILLEQLAYVDNFMPSLEQDFANLDSWILQDPGSDSTAMALGGNSSSNGQRLNESGLGFDERLAAELSAFADDSFIFPDEDKRQRQSISGAVSGNSDNNNPDNNDNDLYGNPREFEDGNDANNNDNSERQQGTGRRSAHFLTQRRNTFLTSQYDHSKSRFSSKSREKRDAESQQQQQQHEEASSSSRNQDNANTTSNVTSNSVTGSPLQDHGGFTNVDIVSGGNGGGAPAGANDDTRSPRFPQHTPNVPSPLSNILASQVMQPYSVSASPVTTTSRPSDSVSVASDPQVPAAAASNQTRPQIHVPDYSTIPTSTLVALLPRVSVPPGAHRTLVNSGFNQEQIHAIAAIIAHHEQEKSKRHTEESVSIESQPNNVNDQDASRGAEFLLGILSRDSRSQQQQQQQQLQRDQQGFVESLLQLDPRTHDQGGDPIRSESQDGGQGRIKREHSISGIEFEEDEEEEDTEIINPTSSRPLKRSKSTEEALSSSSNAKRRNVSNGVAISPPSTTTSATSAQVQKTHQRRKVKERELENSVTELSELAISLQQKIHTLEMENKLLKNLVRSSGELEGIEKAESIRKQIMDKINGSNDE
ncbi:hypothetical protein ZYGR_0H02440 [Zygosaccharomyces rouxii]|uniref:BZIP domain-containing protein n=1 Tax=Zygosaccharomyces rouxii TaxID=4956 RepID=A0A1Q2ZV58_ZYGRO|nr:hypothetical protein ZYGR_0H02440 [Zygosaccharomyces rouxii]